MKILALTIGLLLLVIGSGLWRGEVAGPQAIEAHLWLQMLKSTPKPASESVLATRGGNLGVSR